MVDVKEEEEEEGGFSFLFLIIVNCRYFEQSTVLLLVCLFICM
jgi:hypothetical protein